MKTKSNPVARDLRTPKYRKRIVKDRKKYTRKGRPDGKRQEG